MGSLIKNLTTRGFMKNRNKWMKTLAIKLTIWIMPDSDWQYLHDEMGAGCWDWHQCQASRPTCNGMVKSWPQVPQRATVSAARGWWKTWHLCDVGWTFHQLGQMDSSWSCKQAGPPPRLVTHLYALKSVLVVGEYCEGQSSLPQLTACTTSGKAESSPNDLGH